MVRQLGIWLGLGAIGAITAWSWILGWLMIAIFIYILAGGQVG